MAECGSPPRGDSIFGMLKQRHLPSSLRVAWRDGSRPAAPIRGLRGVFVALFLLRILWHVGMRGALRDNRAGDVGQLVRKALERLGGLWVKGGQILATRVEAYPEVFREALVHLRDWVPPLSGDLVKTIIEHELGQPVRRGFREFDVVPIAVDSFGQTHIAWLRESGVKVAIKVQRPDARKAFFRDWALITRFLVFLRLFALGRWPSLGHLRAELERIGHLKTDYRLSAGMMREVRRKADRKTIYVPKVFSRYCTERILVTEFIDGVPMSHYRRARAISPKKTQQWCKENGIRPRKLQRHMTKSAPILLENDMLLLRNNRIAIVDPSVFCPIDGKMGATWRDQWRQRTSSGT